MASSALRAGTASATPRRCRDTAPPAFPTLWWYDQAKAAQDRSHPMKHPDPPTSSSPARAAAAALAGLPRFVVAQAGGNREPRPFELRRPEIPPGLQAFRLCQPAGAEGRDAGDPDQAGDRQPELRHVQHAEHLRAAGATARPAWRPPSTALMAGSARRAGLALRPRRAAPCACRTTSLPIASCCAPRRAFTTARGSRPRTSPFP